MSLYVKSCRQIFNNKCVGRLVRIEYKISNSQYSLYCNVGTRRFSLAATCSSQRYYKIDNKKEKKAADIPPTDATPLAVRMVYEDLNKRKEMQSSTPDKETLSLDSLKQKLDHISWDINAHMNKELNKMDESEIQQTIQPHIHETESDDSIEQIMLDEKKVYPKKKTKYGIIKEIVGTPDPSFPKTDIACSGCGALLHCQDASVAGYLPSEKLKTKTRDELKRSICQRCHLMTHHNVCLNVKVDEKEYPEIISKIKTSRGLVLVIVDLTDFPNSIFRNLLKHIGINRPIYVVGNKVDLLAKDDRGYLERVKQHLIKECEASGLNPSGSNLRHVCLVSAKTGYGIEQLVTKLMSQWKLKGHVFLVGCTNVGKSSLFNALLGSDYCKSHVRDLIHRATVSTWPGTTVSLLKFPIVNPEPRRLKARVERLIEEQKKEVEERKQKKLEMEDNKEEEKTTRTILGGKVGLTDFRSERQKCFESTLEYEGQEIVSFEMTDNKTLKTKYDAVSDDTTVPDMSFDEKLTNSRWTFDTPGVINSEQIINLLTPEELELVLPRRIIIPRVFVLRPSQVMFVSGLGRIDFTQGSKSIFFTVHCSPNIPIHVIDGDKAEDFYNEKIGTKELGVPIGKERLSSLPRLESKDIDVLGINWDEAAVDIQLSSLGWVSVTAGFAVWVGVRAYTPGGRGIYVRSPALLPHYRSFRGSRIGKSPVYRPR